MSFVPHFGHWRVCQAEGCTNPTTGSYCGLHTQTPEDPEQDLRDALRQRFLEMLFSESEAAELADVWADPLEVGWNMEKYGMSHIRAAQIYGYGRPSKEDSGEEGSVGDRCGIHDAGGGQG